LKPVSRRRAMAQLSVEKQSLIEATRTMSVTPSPDLETPNGIDCMCGTQLATDDVEADETHDRMPVRGDDLLVYLRAKAADGSLIEDRPPMEYEVGSNDLGPISSECERLVTNMKKGDEATVNYGEAAHDGAKLTLKLEKICTTDVSFAQDRSLLKKRLSPGSGKRRPPDGARVTLRVESASDGIAPLAGFAASVMDFTLGNGEVCDALECVAMSMRKGERAILKTRASRATVGDTVRVLRSNQGQEGRVGKIITDDNSNQPYLLEDLDGWFSEDAIEIVHRSVTTLLTEPRLGLTDITAEKVVLTTELVDFEEREDLRCMARPALLEFALARKEIGTSLFKLGRVQLALQRYRGVVQLLASVDWTDEEELKPEVSELKKVCELNQAACHLKLKELSCAERLCNAVLQDDPNNAKALYRRAQAELGLENFLASIRDCKLIIATDTSNRDARILLKQALEAHEKAKGFFGNMRNVLA